MAALAIPASAMFAADPPNGRGRVSAGDVDDLNEEVAAAYSALVSMWTSEFGRRGMQFDAPRLVRYRGTTRTSCGLVPASNALYCYENNTIYFDELFLAAEAKRTGQALGTDGDMAAVGIIAHEMGHAVAYQLGFRSRSEYKHEAAADCLAGAFARHSQENGLLEAGDTDEAFYAMAAAADQDLELTEYRRGRTRRLGRQTLGIHGTRDQRQRNFKTGFEQGSASCLNELS
jgi:predicted metalloprotease